MSSKAEAASVFQRVDVKLGLGLATAIGVLLVALAVGFFLLATHETAELLEESLARELAALPAREARGAPMDPDAVVAVRRIDEDGTVRLLQGRWPGAGAMLPAGTSSVRLAFADPRDHLLLGSSLAEGGRIEAAVSLSSFAAERREQRAQLLASLAASIAGLVIVTWMATRLALAPIREATRAVEAVDEHHLGARIPVRGTGDDLDRHARALNRVLSRLEEAFDRMKAFSADVAHELRTPVNRMVNLADLVLVREGTGSSGPELCALRDAAEGMRRLIDDLLLLAKGDEGRLAARREPVPLEPLLDGLASLFRPAFEERKITLSVRKEANAVALGDRDLLQRALSNLLDNAMRYTPEGGRVEVSLARRGALAELAVSDSGPGIPDSERERVFDRFVRLDESRVGEGTGLGLPLVRMLARVQGGEVSLQTSPLAGASFRVTLPAYCP